MKDNITTFKILFSALFSIIGSAAPAAVVQTNYSTSDSSIPGGSFVTTNNLLATNLTSSSHSGSFYTEQTGNWPVVVGRLYDGQLGPNGGETASGENKTTYSVMPNTATIQFDLNGAFDLTEIRTYASWDSGRDAQDYVVKYATSAAPTTFNILHDLDAFNPPGGNPSSSLVKLTSNSGALVANVVSLQFEFNGLENGGTGYREFQVSGTSATAVPEPGTFIPAAVLVAGAILRRRRSRSHRSGRATA